MFLRPRFQKQLAIRRPTRTKARFRPQIEALESRLALAVDFPNQDVHGLSSGTTEPDTSVETLPLHLVVTVIEDEVDGDNSPDDLSLREAIILANEHLVLCHALILGSPVLNFTVLAV